MTLVMGGIFRLRWDGGGGGGVGEIDGGRRVWVVLVEY